MTRSTRILTGVAWCLFFILVGGSWIYGETYHIDTGTIIAIGVGLVLIGLNIARNAMGVSMGKLSLGTGTLALLIGFARYFGIRVDLVPLVIILIGLFTIPLIIKKPGLPRQLGLERSGLTDTRVAETAKKHGGFLTLTVLCYETGESLSAVRVAVERFVEEGEARVLRIGDMKVYDIPSARVHLLGADKTLLELVIRHNGRTNRAELLRESSLSIEALDAGLKRLETQGILTQSLDGRVMLAIVSNA